MILLKFVEKIKYLELNDIEKFGVFLADAYNLRFCDQFLIQAANKRLALGLCVVLFCLYVLFCHNFHIRLYGLWL